jgi:predicted DNA-binding mobile mystery protein A
MGELTIDGLKKLKKVLCAEAERETPSSARMSRRPESWAEERRELDEQLLPFRMARRTAAPADGWLRTIRHVVGVPVNDVVRRLGVSAEEVFRREKSEREERIQLGTLRQAAGALGCDLIYALVPREGGLEEMAAAEKKVQETAWQVHRAKLAAEAKDREEVVLQRIGWRTAIRKSIRKGLRKAGIRVR